MRQLKTLLGAMALASVLVPVGIGPVVALEVNKEAEKAALKACEQQICEMVVKKDAGGQDLKCEVGKTWAKDKLKEGSEKRKLTWSFGDARCGVAFSLARSGVLEALSKPAHTLEFKPETAKCEIERDKELTTVTVAMQPKLQFKDGKVEKVWLGVKSIEAPAVVKGVIWTAAQIEDTLGLFHGELVSEINEMIQDRCPKKVGAN